MSNEESFKRTFSHAGHSVVVHGSSVLQGSIDERIAELEVENLRLQRLVAELLLKNQQLRKQEPDVLLT